ncbi:MAG: hypothetical protein ACFFFH_04225 [Candidatus Thorarchaeota archaeon]
MFEFRFYKERRIILWIIGTIIMLGLSEGMNAYVLENKGSWEIYIPYWIVFAITVLMILAIIPLVTQKTEDWILIIGLAFLAQFLEDIAHVISYGILSGDYILWTPLWDFLGITFPIPLFWIIDFILFGIFFLIFLVHKYKF